MSKTTTEVSISYKVGRRHYIPLIAGILLLIVFVPALLIALAALIFSPIKDVTTEVIVILFCLSQVALGAFFLKRRLVSISRKDPA